MCRLGIRGGLSVQINKDAIVALKVLTSELVAVLGPVVRLLRLTWISIQLGEAKVKINIIISIDILQIVYSCTQVDSHLIKIASVSLI